MKFDPNIAADRILSIPESYPGMLFSSPTDAKDEYRLLAKIWHPDRNPDPKASDVLAKVNILWSEAQRMIEADSWTIPGELLLESKVGQRFKLRYKLKRTIDVGTMYYGETVLAFVVDEKHSSLFDSAEKAISSLKYADSKMREDVSRFVPKITKSFQQVDGSRVMVVPKTEDAFLLRDVVEQQGGKLDPKHAAWVTSRLMGLCCYMDWAGISHNSMTLDTVFISPKYHTALLLGGWWFSKPLGGDVKVVPKAIHSLLPSSVLKDKVASGKTDRLTARAIGREVAGDRTGLNLKKLGVPEPMADFLRHPLGSNPYDELRTWQKVLEKSFGPRKFTVLDIPKDRIYEKDAT